MKKIWNRARIYSVAATLSLGLSLASTQASALVIATATAAHHLGHVPHHPGHHTSHHGACAAGVGVTLGLGFAFMFLCWPVGVLLDGEQGQGIKVEAQKNLYSHLPFLKGTQEGIDIEKFISNRIAEVSKDISVSDQDVTDQAITKHADFQIAKNEDGSQNLCIVFPAKWIEEKLNDGEYTREQIDQAIEFLTKF